MLGYYFKKAYLNDNPAITVTIITNIDGYIFKNAKKTDLMRLPSLKTTNWVRIHFKIDIDHGSNDLKKTMIHTDTKSKMIQIRSCSLSLNSNKS